MKRLGNMSREEMEKEARTAFDLDSYKAAKALEPITDDLLKELLANKRKDAFDATPFFDRAGKRWTVDLEGLEEAMEAKNRETPSSGKRPGWTAERRAKTLATKAAKRAAREKEVVDLRNEISRLELELIEAEALILAQKEELERLRINLLGGTDHSSSERMANDLREIKESVQATNRGLGQILVEAADLFIRKAGPEAQEILGLRDSPYLDTNDAMDELSEAMNPVPARGEVEPSIEVTRAIKAPEVPLETMSVYELNKKAAFLHIPADVNKDRLISRIRKAMKE
jgi:hypothetical protein